MQHKSIKYLLAGLLVLATSSLALAQTAESNADPYFFDKLLANGLMITVLLIVVATLFTLYKLLMAMTKVQQIRIYEEHGLDEFLEAVKAPQPSLWTRLYNRWTDRVPVEKEEEILFDHDFDGIRELDNNLPPWWVAMFYLSIIGGVIYLGYYHVFKIGPSSQEQYEMNMEEAEKAVALHLSRQADQLDETNVVFLEDEAELALGASIFKTNCASCHGEVGEGALIGPNLTDRYWLNGGSINDVFTTIKYGVPAKGMIAWKSQLRASDMQRVASYILSLQGSNPPNAREPQGELYVPETASPEPDSLTTGDDAVGMN